MKCCKAQLPAILYLFQVEGFNPSLAFFVNILPLYYLKIFIAVLRYLLSSRQALRPYFCYVLSKHKLSSHPIRTICSIDSTRNLSEYLQGKCKSPVLGMGAMFLNLFIMKVLH